MALAHRVGICNEQRIPGWNQVTDAVHRQGCYLFRQLWHQRNALVLIVKEIQEKMKRYVAAAKNAMAAGFDGVEINGANGQAPDRPVHAQD
ncbi:hypothetical protein GGR51DRAFT_562319 [Nemania sp. FL0031]|nr:hypothetical protein GGR51DRAFT_562319 [Nemania sp. FL0031]